MVDKCGAVDGGGCADVDEDLESKQRFVDGWRVGCVAGCALEEGLGV